MPWLIFISLDLLGESEEFARMKKQINPTIKAHLIRSAFYVLLLVAVCVIPFALAQRKTARQSLAEPGVAQNGAKQAVTQRAMTAGPVAPPQHISRPAGIGCTGYNFTVGTDTFVPGVTDAGNHCDDCLTSITLPFAVNLYNQSFTSVFAGSNGALFFGSGNASFVVTCSPFGLMGTSYVLAPYWANQCTAGCASTACTNCGIFTTTTGTAPNRVFYIEFLTNYYNQAIPLDYEVALFENHTPSF
jgi:hypothetical protein